MMMARLLKSKALWAAAVLVALVGLYALLGFYAAPKLLRSQAIEFVRNNYGRELRVGEVRVNPFKLQLDVRDVSFPDADQQQMLGLQRLFVDFEIASLWNRAFTFKQVQVEFPAVRAVIRPDGSMNLAELALPEDPKDPDSPPPALWIKSLVVSDGQTDVIDQARATVAQEQFKPIAFQLSDFRTTPEGGVFVLSARGRSDERLEWKGRVELTPKVGSRGNFSLGNVSAKRLAEILGDTVPFAMTKGTIDIAGNYDFTAADKVDLRVVLPRMQVSSLTLRARGADSDWVEIPGLLVTDTRIAYPENTVAIDDIALTGMKAQVWREQDGSINLNRLFAPAPAATAASALHATAVQAQPAVASKAAPTVTPARSQTSGAEPTPEPAWQVSVGALDVRDAAVAFEDRTVQPAAKFALAPLQVGLKEVSLDLTRPLPITIDAHVNGKAHFTATGDLTPAPLATNIDFRLDGFNLGDLQPYLGASTDMTVKSGTLAMVAKLGMTPPGGADPELTLAGDLQISGFRSIDNALEKDFFLFDRMDVSKLRYASIPDSLSIDRIRILKPFNRVIIASNQTLNVSAVFDPEGTAAAVKAHASAAAAGKPAQSRKKTRAEKRAEAKAAAAEAKARAAAPPPDLNETGMPIRIRELRVENGRMDFADFSIQPNFAADVTALNGSVTGMSTDPKARAKISLKGKVGDFSPVLISGDVQPFAYANYTNIGLKFENISLPIFNPYSGRFAGYNIAKGKLTTDLHYSINKRKLDATHKIRIDQLEWGEATAGKSEATLPVKFATSLLRDSDGVITLDVPVKGTLDDPSFRIGPIIWQIVKNILTKAVTFPFKALGGLFKDSDDAQFVDFAAGQAALDATSTERLASLGKALAPKEGLHLDVPIGALAAIDETALVTQRYEAERQAAVSRTLGAKRAKADATIPAFDTLEPDQQLVVLKDLVQNLTGKPAVIPDPAKPPEGTSRKEAKALAQTAALDYLGQTARSHITVTAETLEALGRQRAEAIQKVLLSDTGLDPQRVFIISNGKVAAKDGKVRLELGMK